jgi:hypothetical protein
MMASMPVLAYYSSTTTTKVMSASTQYSNVYIQMKHTSLLLQMYSSSSYTIFTHTQYMLGLY